MKMGDKLKSLIVLATGVAIGSVSSWYLLKDKYKKYADEEIASVKERYKEKQVELEKKSKETIDIPEEPEPEVKTEPEVNRDLIDYSKLVTNSGYKSDDKKGGSDVKAPYVIKPEEFDTIGYDTVSLTYYADKILTDEKDEPVPDIDYLVGEDSLEHFGEYEDDSVFVRNDELKTDFEILLDARRYYEN